MNYQIRRIDPFWFAHPAVPATAIGGAVLAFVGVVVGGSNPAGLASRFLIVVGACACGLAILAATKPAISAMMEVLGLLGYSYSIFITPDLQMVSQSFLQKLLATILAASIYAVLVDALVLAAAFFYNLFSAIWGGIQLDIEQAPGGD
jgi:peptidoglycan/LPS O-acetylase OafA/YrhL